MGDFWPTVLFRAGLYRRNALQAHTDLHAASSLGQEHYARWLALWRILVDDHFSDVKAELASCRPSARRVEHPPTAGRLGQRARHHADALVRRARTP